MEETKRGSSQLLCFLHGPGGSGKTTVVNLAMEYAHDYCEHLDFPFTSRTIVITAMTGVAATILLGEMTHSAMHLNQKKPIEAEQVELWEGSKMLTVDKISFASKDKIVELHKKLCCLKNCFHSPCGGLNIMFAGDMHQLEPVGEKKKPLHMKNCPEFKDWVNCYMELRGMHQFQHDLDWGLLLQHFRNGEVTSRDIDTINE